MNWLRFRNWQILPKILTITILSVIMIDTVILLFFLPIIEEKILQGHKNGVRNVVNVAYGLVAEYDKQVQQGVMSMYEARVRASLDLRSLRYNENDYFFITDPTPKLLMHPIKPELEGQPMQDFKDPAGTFLFREFARVTKESGAGYVAYLWPKPGLKDPVPKISYVKLFDSWDWIIGSGVYIDDVKEDMRRLRTQILLGTVLFIMITLTLAYWIGRGITRPLDEVIRGLRRIARSRGDIELTKRIAIASEDEIGTLTREFNGLMQSINRISSFKKVIEEDERFEVICNRLGETFRDNLGIADCIIFQIEADNGRMSSVYPPLLTAEEIFCNPAMLDNCDICKAKNTGHIISSLKYRRHCRQFLPAEEKEQYCIPLIVAGTTIGVVQLMSPLLQEDSPEYEAFMYAVSRAEHYVNEALPVIETKRLMEKLQESALTDALTTLHNRRFLVENIDKLVAGVLRRGRPLGLVMCDIDYFKQVNDQHGHDAGDAVLKETSNLITSSVRAADWVIRFGGEEFLVLLMDIEPGSSSMIAEKIRRKMEEASFRIPNGSLKKTISLGVCEFPQDCTTIWQAIKFADVALYKAKEGGRNRVVRFSEEMWTEKQF